MNTPIDPDLAVTLRQLNLGRIRDTLSERLALAKTNKLGRAEFFQVVSDEVTLWDAPPRTVGVGKTFLATALGQIAVRRRHGVHFECADRLHKRRRTAMLDSSRDANQLTPPAPPSGPARHR